MRVIKWMFLVVIVIGFSLTLYFNLPKYLPGPGPYLQGDYIDRVDQKLVQKVYKKQLSSQEIEGLWENLEQQEINIEKVMHLSKESKEKANKYVMDFWTDFKIQRKRIQLRLDLLNYQKNIDTENKCRIYATIFPAFRYMKKEELEKIDNLREKIEKHFHSDFSLKSDFKKCNSIKPFYSELISYDNEFEILTKTERKYVMNIYIGNIKERINIIKDSLGRLKEEGEKKQALSLYKELQRWEEKLDEVKKMLNK